MIQSPVPFGLEFCVCFFFCAHTNCCRQNIGQYQYAIWHFDNSTPAQSYCIQSLIIFNRQTILCACAREWCWNESSICSVSPILSFLVHFFRFYFIQMKPFYFGFSINSNILLLAKLIMFELLYWSDYKRIERVKWLS